MEKNGENKEENGMKELSKDFKMNKNREKDEEKNGKHGTKAHLRRSIGR